MAWLYAKAFMYEFKTKTKILSTMWRNSSFNIMTSHIMWHNNRKHANKLALDPPGPRQSVLCPSMFDSTGYIFHL